MSAIEAIEEPLWVVWTREYVIPLVVFCGLMYYLIRYVFYPLRTFKKDIAEAKSYMDESKED